MGAEPMNSLHWPNGRPPQSSAEWQAYRADQHESFLDSLDRKEEPIPEPYTSEIRIDPPEEPDPVTPLDRTTWLTKANWKRDKEWARLHHMTMDEIHAMNDEIQQEVDAQAFAKRFEHWCEKGCPLDSERTNNDRV
jgi:hypothetical protein